VSLARRAPSTAYTEGLRCIDVLRYLVEHPGPLVTQDELLEVLWPEIYLNPELIKKYILGIRKVLGDQHDNPVYIETLPKRGYQFIAPVTDRFAEDPHELSSEAVSKMVGRAGPLGELQVAFKKALPGHQGNARTARGAGTRDRARRNCTSTREETPI
jgi:DNA-binding winged helix-turn-helix (wHTH) protein